MKQEQRLHKRDPSSYIKLRGDDYTIQKKGSCYLIVEPDSISLYRVYVNAPIN